MTNEKDTNAIHELFYEFHRADDLGVIKTKLAEYVATVRAEEQRNFVNNIAAVLDANEVEAFTALIMKAKASPDLKSETRSALRSEAEIRAEEREAAFKEAARLVNAMSRIEARHCSVDFLNGAQWARDQAANLLASQVQATEK